MPNAYFHGLTDDEEAAAEVEENPIAASHIANMVFSMLVKRIGEPVTLELARERANNIAQALVGVEVA